MIVVYHTVTIKFLPAAKASAARRDILINDIDDGNIVIFDKNVKNVL